MKRNEVVTLISSKVFTGLFSACREKRGGGEGGQICVSCMTLLRENFSFNIDPSLGVQGL